MSGSRSEAEQRMAALLKRSRTGPWVPNHPVRDASGRIVAEIDFAHEGLRIAIEVDGRAHHSDRRSFERDRERQNHLVLQGWLILRFTWEQITQRPQEVIAAVLAAVAQRAA
jgi:very-short-patch-repair endonuclease